MIRINLLPFRAARKKENVRRQISIFVLSLILLFLTLTVAQNWSGNKLEKMEADLKETKAEVDRLSKITDKIKKYKKEIAETEQKIKVIQQLEADRTEPVRLLDAMTDLIIPNRMWFTAFDAKGNNVEVKGIAIDNKTVADFMTRLENSKRFSAVNLQNVKLDRIRNLDMKSFQITCIKAQQK